MPTARLNANWICHQSTELTQHKWSALDLIHTFDFTTLYDQLNRQDITEKLDQLFQSIWPKMKTKRAAMRIIGLFKSYGPDQWKAVKPTTILFSWKSLINAIHFLITNNNSLSDNQV